MLSPRWMKVVRDLWSNRTRTILVVASIAVGIFAVGTVQQLSTVVLGEMQAVYETSNASNATIFASGLDDDMIDSIESMPEVATAEGRGNARFKVEVTPGQWEPLAPDHFLTSKRCRSTRYSWSTAWRATIASERRQATGHPKTKIVLERSSLDTDSLPGEPWATACVVETVDGKIRTVTVSGAVYDPTGFPPSRAAYWSRYRGRCLNHWADRPITLRSISAQWHA